MHLLGCLHLLLVIVLTCSHFVHLHFLFLLCWVGVFSTRLVVSFRVLVWCLSLMHLPYLSHRVSSFFVSLVWMLRMAGSSCLTSFDGWMALSLTPYFVVTLIISLRSKEMFSRSLSLGFSSFLWFFLKCHVWRNWFILAFRLSSRDLISPGVFILNILSATRAHVGWALSILR